MTALAKVGCVGLKGTVTRSDCKHDNAFHSLDCILLTIQ